MLLTNWIRAAVSGETVDGRKIGKNQIQEMATSYNPEVYQAKIWLEHLRGVVPDNVFKSLGNVAAVKSEVIETGDLAGKTALYVKFSPSNELVKLVRSGQKTHLSIELHPEFPHTKGAYLMGLGVTDSPASLGTGIMSFNAGSRKENLFSEPVLFDLTEEFKTSDDEGDELAKVKSMVVKLTKKLDAKSNKFNSKNFVKAKKFNKLLKKFKRFEDFMDEEEPQPKFNEHGASDNEKLWDH